jgi:exonuclease III
VTWRTTFVYGEPKRELWHVFWDQIRSLSTTWNGPWVCYGDFNEVLSQDEHVGPRDRRDAQITTSQDCLQDCNLMDLGFDGPKYTWSNQQDANSNIRVRLDRAVANSAFSQTFGECSVTNLITTSSDHYDILISL